MLKRLREETHRNAWFPLAALTCESVLSETAFHVHSCKLPLRKIIPTICPPN
jgi:hypothetical protein